MLKGRMGRVDREHGRTEQRETARKRKGTQ